MRPPQRDELRAIAEARAQREPGSRTYLGHHLARDLRLEPATRRLPVIGISGRIEPGREVLQYVDAFVCEPVDLAALAELVRARWRSQPRHSRRRQRLTVRHHERDHARAALRRGQR